MKMFIKLNVLIVLLLILKYVTNESKNDIEADITRDKPDETQQEYTIAIIGCGVGGSSAAYFLNELVSSDPPMRVHIDCYEKNDYIGGRLATQVMNGRQYDIGGSIIHDRNHYAKKLVEKLGLSKRSDLKDSDERLCLYNGKSFDFCESSWTFITYAKILIRYGFDVNRMKSRVEKIIDAFEKIYKLQEYKVKFDNVDDLLDAMSPEIQNLTKTVYKDFLFNHGFSKKFINELVQAISLVNYGQDVSVPAFVGAVSFAGAGAQLWAIEGGNKMLPKKLMENSNANLMLKTTVDSVQYVGPNHFDVTFHYNSGTEKTYNKKSYSGVIIATPITEQQFRFDNFSFNMNPHVFGRKYHRTVATLVSGEPNKKFKDRTIISDNKSNFFTSLSRIHPVDGIADQIPVYKVFSPQLLTKDQLGLIFDSTQMVKETDWLAYPHYEGTTSQPLPSFVLTPGMYHLNAIEWSASAIEMSLIGGKNVALLMYSHLGGKTSDVKKERIKKKMLIDEL